MKVVSLHARTSRWRLVGVVALALAASACEEEGERIAPDSAPAEARQSGQESPICCEFNGAIGVSTKTKCEDYDGKVLELEPPCTGPRDEGSRPPNAETTK